MHSGSCSSQISFCRLEGLDENVLTKHVDIFDPILKDILRLVDAQVKDALYQRSGSGIKGIFMVGGFGSSKYLKNVLQEIYEPQGIQVIKPHDAWGAIVNGAVLSRLADQASVVSTKALRHYGVIVRGIYNPLVDRGRPIVYSLGDSAERADKMIWYIRKGADLKRDQVIKFPFYQTIPANYTPNDLIFHSRLRYSDAPFAPVYPGPGLETSCRFRADLRQVNKQVFRPKTGDDGKLYYDVDYNLVLCTTDANMKFSLEMDGREMGSVEANYV